MTPPRVLVVTIVHTPLDARIWSRQIRALLDADIEVTYAAPFTARGVPEPTEVRSLDLPRAQGRRRLDAVRAARQLILAEADRTDLVLIHDPDLLLAVRGDALPPVVWDVHEDTSAALSDRDWVPDVVRPVARRVVAAAERRAERAHHLILAEDRYAPRFGGEHPVIHNYPDVPDAVEAPAAGRAVYIGRVSPSRGAAELVEVGTRIGPDVALEVVGWPDGGADRVLAPAHDAGAIRWVGRDGYVPNEVALGHLAGATAGLSLLHDEPNYRHSLPTKIVEYMAHGVPVVTTPLAAAVELVERYDCGLIVPFGDAMAAADAVSRLHRDDDLRARLGANGHRAAREHLSWQHEGQRFVELIRGWAAT